MPERSVDVRGAEYVETGMGAELRVATKEHASARIKSIAQGDAAEELSIVMEEFSSLTFVFQSKATKRYRARIAIELDECARATLVILPSGEGDSDIELRATLGKEAELMVAQVLRDGKTLKYTESIDLRGQDAGAHVLTLAAPAGTTALDLSTHMRFGAARTRGSVRALGFLRGVSKTIYRVTGEIARGITNPESSEEARFLVLERGAEISAIPSLDIASDRVDTTHKLAVHPIGEAELFYPKTRGMTEKEARAMLEEGYLERELSCLKSDDLVALVREAIAPREAKV